MPRPKAVRNKHIFDPEHGGGRIRRNKQLPKQKFYLENPDKIGYEHDFPNSNDVQPDYKFEYE